MESNKVNENEISANKIMPAPLDERHVCGLDPFIRKPELATSRFYMGSLVSFLSTGNDTGGRTSLMIYSGKPGNEPPPHLHEREHETYYILEGIVEFYCDGKVMLAGPGELVFLPMGKAHAFYIRTAQVKLLISLQATSEQAVGLDEYFLAMSHPADSMAIPDHETTYSNKVPEHAIEVGNQTGVIIIKPEEIAELLPHYPGFGVKRELIYE